MKKKILRRIAIFLLLSFLIPTNMVFAQNDGSDDGNNGGGNDESPPDNPGVGGGSQTVIRTSSAMWVLPHGDTFFINGYEVNIIEDWELLEITATEDKRGNGPVYFVAIDGLTEGAFGCEDGNCYPNCGNGGGVGACIPATGEEGDDDCNGNGGGNGCTGSGNNGNGNGPNAPDDCHGMWVEPGVISAYGEQIAPAHAVVVGQDPEANGATIQWTVQIEPTTLVYKDWQLLGHRHLACVENGQLDENGNGNIYDPGDTPCPFGWHEVIQHIWGCTEEYEHLREGIGDLSAEASLKQASRGWIQGELAVAYPGATLLNPDWSYSTTPNCTWLGDVCYWNFSINIPVTDPGWYDIKVAGTTAGTRASTPRGFELIAGEFGVYLLDNTVLIQ